MRRAAWSWRSAASGAHLVPVPWGEDLDELNEACRAGDAADDARRIGARRSTVGQDFAAEAPHLLALPAEDFDATRHLDARVDTKARVCVRQCHYSLPARLAGRTVRVALGATAVEAYDGARLVARHTRSVHRGEQTLVLDHYLEVLMHKPGALPGSVALAQARAAGAFSATHEAFWSEVRRRVATGPAPGRCARCCCCTAALAHDAVVAGMAAALAVGLPGRPPEVVGVEAHLAGPRRCPPPRPSFRRFLRLGGPHRGRTPPRAVPWRPTPHSARPL